MTISDADRSLAAELGLFLVRRAENPGAPEGAAPPSAAETWLVKSVLTRRAVGRLQFTAVDCLLVVKTTTDDRVIEETVADAIRWLSPLIRHARTGHYAGTEVIVRRFGSTFERPRALTECGAKATGGDFTPVTALSALINGQIHEMCLECRERLEARATQTIPDPSGTASPRQRSYIRRLVDEGTRHGRPDLVETRIIDHLSSRAASMTIDALKALRARDWKGPL